MAYLYAGATDVVELPWLGDSVGWSEIPCTKTLWVQVPVRTHASSVVGSGAHMGDN